MLGVVRGGEEGEEAERAESDEETGSKHAGREESTNLGAGEPGRETREITTHRQTQAERLAGQSTLRQTIETRTRQQRAACASSQREKAIFHLGKRKTGWPTVSVF